MSIQFIPLSPDLIKLLQQLRYLFALICYSVFKLWVHLDYVPLIAKLLFQLVQVGQQLVDMHCAVMVLSLEPLNLILEVRFALSQPILIVLPALHLKVCLIVLHLEHIGLFHLV